ncbi:MAG: hypothetical protein HYS13_00080 [Planctomycetia bacterium]|nr:hypothetical protein [Planctomycetia bacterium]
MSASNLPRDIVYEPQFDDELAQIQPDFWRADEAMQGVEHLLGRFPQVGYQVQDSPVWYFPLLNPVEDFPPVYIFYTFDDKQVFFLSIRRMSTGNGHS